MNMHRTLYRDVLPRLQGTKIRGCHFCLPFALTLPCNHSMWSVLSGFSLRSETKAFGPEVFTAVTTLQMSALACPLSLLPPPKKALNLFKLASFPMSPCRVQYEVLWETEHMYVHEKQPFSQWTSPPPLLEEEESGLQGSRRDLVPSSTQQSHWMPSNAAVPICAHMAQGPMSPPRSPGPHHHSSLQWEQSFQTALLLLWSETPTIFKHIYRSDCILLCSFFSSSSPLLI